MVDDTGRGREIPDRRRRELLRAGAAAGLGALALPLLEACGGSDSLSATGGANPPPSTPPSGPQPRGLHVSFTGDTTSTRTVTWFTDGTDDPGSMVQYGLLTPGMSAAQIAAAPLPSSAQGSAAAAYGVPVLTHAATLTGLPAGQGIRYRVGSASGWSSVRTLPATPTGAFRFCHFGDHAMSDASRAVLAGVQQRAPDFLIIAGDLSYANGTQTVWDDWFNMVDPLTSRLPTMTCPGNHEAEDGDGAGYSSRFTQPGKNTYYAWDYGNIHFFFSTGGSLVNKTTDAAALAAELLAMEADLAQAALRRARGEIDFIAVVQHYTIWTDDDGRDPADFTLVALEEDILLRYGVDLLLVGHDHIYERSKPMAYGKPFDGGYVQVTQGGGGQSLYQILANRASWSAFGTVRHGFCEYAVDASGIRGTTYAVDDAANNLLAGGKLEVIDQFSLTPRAAAARAAFVHPARKAEALLGKLDHVVEHTVTRNALHDALERAQTLKGIR